ncbi:MAG: TRAP transporter small permease [Deltaproteobacteria bacterium]|nr:TRAP transporter small permease [Deltaproteobacteria bacterium]
MGVLAAWLERITKWGVLGGGVFLLGAMMLLISNIVGRLVNFVIPGSYEIFELIMVVPVSFALVHAALKKYHVVVELIIKRFPPRLGAVAEMFASLLMIVTWGWMAYAGTSYAIENGFQELSETLEIPYLPFRMLFLFCLLLFCLTYVVDFAQAFRRFSNK